MSETRWTVKENEIAIAFDPEDIWFGILDLDGDWYDGIVVFKQSDLGKLIDKLTELKAMIDKNLSRGLDKTP